MMDTYRLERAISAFRAALPDFQTFLEPGETFANEELNYKRSLSSGFQPLGEKLLEGAYTSDPSGFLNALKELLTDQNLVGWRDIQIFFDIVDADEESRQVSIQRIKELLSASIDQHNIAAAIDKFVYWLSEQDVAPGQTKIWPSLLLFMWRPDRYIFVKPDFFDRALNAFGFERLGRGRKLDGELYERMMRDMLTLREGINALHPRDFIDVQSFLWKAVSLQGNTNLGESEVLPRVRVWILRVEPKQLGDRDSVSLTMDLTEHKHQLDFYRRCIRDEFHAGDVVVLLAKGASRVLAEGLIQQFDIEGDSLMLQLARLTRKEIRVTAQTNYQLIVPGLFADIGVHAHGAGDLCCEYFDKTRSAYLLTWNPELFHAGGDGTEAGRLGYCVSERTSWSCHNTQARPGDPVYVIRLGQNWPRGIVAKGRVCSLVEETEHWDRSRAGSRRRAVLIEFEGIRDDPDRAGLPIEELNQKYPEQRWSSQVSGIVINPEYRTDLHHTWKHNSNDDFLQRAFRAFTNTDLYANWVPHYRSTTRQVDEARASGEPPHDDLLELLWYRNENGISGAGRGQMSRTDFDNSKEFLRDQTEELIRTPHFETFQRISKDFQALKAAGSISRVPRLVIRRAFVAANPTDLCTLVSLEELNALGQLLATRYGEVFSDADNWFEQNLKLRAFLRGHGIPDDDLAAFNCFCWHLLTTLRKGKEIPALEPTPKHKLTEKNIIYYGPPGTGKTYALREELFPLYTSQAATLSEAERLNEVLSEMNRPDQVGKPVRRYEFVTFHQSYSYEEFVEGIRPTLGTDGESLSVVSYVLHSARSCACSTPCSSHPIGSQWRSRSIRFQDLPRHAAIAISTQLIKNAVPP